MPIPACAQTLAELFGSKTTGMPRNWLSGGGDVMCYIVQNWSVSIVMNLCRFGELGEKGSIIMCVNRSRFGDYECCG